MDTVPHVLLAVVNAKPEWSCTRPMSNSVAKGFFFFFHSATRFSRVPVLYLCVRHVANKMRLMRPRLYNIAC